MITVKLIGGQGNQMFQYAYGRKISILKKEKLKLDITFLLSRIPRKDFTFRRYELEVFNIEADLTMLSKIALYFHNYTFIFQIMKNKLSRLLLKESVLNELENYLDLEKKALNVHHDIYLSGLFVDEKSVSSIDEVIRKDFSYKEKLDGSNKIIADNIQKTNSISLHIRRGDLVSLGYTICNSNYYQNAIDYMCKNIENPTFFIFSDDSDWVKKHLKIKQKHVIVDKNIGNKSYIDMRLIELCKHNIIANSTFSWWGAWLNNNPNKIVIVPKLYSDNHPNMIPSNWLRFE